MNIYLAGPMRGIPEFNFPAFFNAAAMLRAAGHSVFSPAERDHDTHGEAVWKGMSGDLGEAVQKGFSLREALRDDTHYICMEAHAIALLPGWEKSKGATAERALAVALGLRVLHIQESGALTEEVFA